MCLLVCFMRSSHHSKNCRTIVQDKNTCVGLRLDASLLMTVVAFVGGDMSHLESCLEGEASPTRNDGVPGDGRGGSSNNGRGGGGSPSSLTPPPPQNCGMGPPPPHAAPAPQQLDNDGMLQQ